MPKHAGRIASGPADSGNEMPDRLTPIPRDQGEGTPGRRPRQRLANGGFGVGNHCQPLRMYRFRLARFFGTLLPPGLIRVG